MINKICTARPPRQGIGVSTLFTGLKKKPTKNINLKSLLKPFLLPYFPEKNNRTIKCNTALKSYGHKADDDTDVCNVLQGEVREGRGWCSVFRCWIKDGGIKMLDAI